MFPDGSGLSPPLSRRRKVPAGPYVAGTRRPPAGRVRSPPLTPALREIRAPVPPWRARCRGGVNGAPSRVREGPCRPVLLLMGAPSEPFSGSPTPRRSLLDLLPQSQSDAQTHTAGALHRTPGASPQACGIGAPAPHVDPPPPTSILPQCRGSNPHLGAGCQQTHTTFQNEPREQRSQESEGDVLAFMVRSHKERNDRIRFSLVVDAGKELRNAHIFCLSSSTARAVRRRALDGCDLGIRLPRGSVIPTRCRRTRHLPGSFFLFFFFLIPARPAPRRDDLGVPQ